MRWLIDALLGCTHKRLTFPMTPNGIKFPEAIRSCLDCGKTFKYDFAAMRMGAPSNPAPVEVDLDAIRDFNRL